MAIPGPGEARATETRAPDTRPPKDRSGGNESPDWGAIALAALIVIAASVVAWWFITSGTAGRMLDDLAPERTGLAESLVLVGLGAVAFGGLAAKLSGERYVGALWLVAPYLPGLAAAITVVAYVVTDEANPYRSDTAFFGLILGLAAWPVLAFPLRAMCSVDRAQGRAYGELLQRSLQIRDRLDALGPAGGRTPEVADKDCPPDDPCAQARAARSEADRQLQYATALLAGQRIRPQRAALELGPAPDEETGMGADARRRRERGGQETAALRWITGSGYNEIARALHRAEEALIDIEPFEAVLGDAIHDDLSLSGSTIENRDRLRDLIRAAVRQVAPDAAAQLLPDGRPAHGETVKIEERAARPILRQVRYSINEFRDDARAGLVTARVNLLWSILFVASGAYLLVGLAVLARISTAALIAASVFFLVGAVVGLFNRVRIEGGRASAVETYGLFQARLLHTPIVSGLAAVAGVYIVAVSPGFFAAIGATKAPAPVDLANIFNMTGNPSGLLVAAIFGLAPSMLTRTLADQGAALEKALQRSEPASRSSSNDAAPG